MGMGLYLSAVVRATSANAPSRANVKADLRSAGIRIGWRGLVTASRCMPLDQYKGLLKFLKAVSDDIRLGFGLKLPPLSIVLGDRKNPAIDFAELVAQGHVAAIVNEFFDYRSQTLDLEFLPAYIRRVRNAGN